MSIKGASATPVRLHTSRGVELSALPPLSLYVHLPWCLKKCPYCDFNSHGLSSAQVPEAAYLNALRADLEAALPLVWGRSVHSVFFGGGTPSLFSPQSLDTLLADLRARLPLQADCEITLEANPGTYERGRFQAFREAGITRLSLGVQTFNDAHLQILGRVHNAAQAREAVQEVARAFETYNLDLMYALPGQTLAELDADLDAALCTQPPHLSVYQLTLEPNTFFAKHPPELPDPDSAYDMLDRIVERTQAAGLGRYEVSAYSRPGHRCRHNLNYWQFGDYLGIGAGAHSKISFPDRILRQERVRDPKQYMAYALDPQTVARVVTQQHEVPQAELPFEYMLNALRLKDGFALQDFCDRTGLTPAVLRHPLQQAQQRGLLARDLHRIWPTPLGYDFLSDVQALFLPTSSRSNRESNGESIS